MKLIKISNYFNKENMNFKIKENAKNKISKN